MTGDELRRLCCKRCGGEDTARSIETISASCGIVGLDDDGQPDFGGETTVHWDSSTTVGFDCSACLAEAEAVLDLFELASP